MSKNVLIPMILLQQILELLNYWDVSKYDCVIQDEYDNVIQQLDIKMKKLQLRVVYSKIINASDEDSRHNARIEYLKQKNQL